MKFASLQERLAGPIVTSLKETLRVKNIYALPRIEKVTVNVGMNRSRMDSKEMLEYVEESLKKITGQKPIFRTARKAISNFKVREGDIVGVMVTLRGKQMHAFLDRLMHVALPRVRDFRGMKPIFDGHGNFSIGLKEHTIFPEVPPPEAAKIFGLQVTLTTTTDSDKEAEALLRIMGMPFRKEKEDDVKPQYEEREGGKGGKKKEKSE